MEQAPELEKPTEETKKMTAEEATIAFHMKLKEHVDNFSKTVNELGSTAEAILFTGAIEQTAGDFKNIFIDVMRVQMAKEGRTKGEIKRHLLQIEQTSRQILVAKHSQPH